MMPSEASNTDHLDTAAKTAILAGKLQWLHEHIGELTQKQLKFVLSTSRKRGFTTQGEPKIEDEVEISLTQAAPPWRAFLA